MIKSMLKINSNDISCYTAGPFLNSKTENI